MWYHGDGKIDGQRCIPNRLQMIHVAMGQCTYYLPIILSQLQPISIYPSVPPIYHYLFTNINQ